jgi:hypothetical protein
MAANGVGVPTQILLAGSNLVHATGPNYSVTLSLTGTTSVVVTPTAKDIAGSDVAEDTSKYVWQSYNAAPNGQPGKVATVSGTATGTITAVAVGQALVEVKYPSFDLDGLNSVLSDKVYALVLVQVTP